MSPKRVSRKPKKQDPPVESDFSKNGQKTIAILHEGSISLDSLIKGFGKFWGYYRDFLRHPFTFVKHINYKDNYILKNSFLFFSYALTIYYILLIPVFIYQDYGINRITFYLRVVVQFIDRVIIAYLCLKLLGGKGTFRQTFSAYLFSTGFLIPLYALSNLPVLLNIPMPIVGGRDVEELINFINTAINNGDQTIIFWGLYATSIMIISTLFSLFHYFAFNSMIHKINWVRLFLAYVLISIIRAPVVIYFEYPLFAKISPYLDKAFDFIL